MIKANYHTHSTFCDGNDSLEDIILSAIERNIEILGFSSHAMYPFSSSWHIPFKEYENYVNSVNNLKEKYKDKIQILLGFEADYVEGLSVPDFETYKKFSPDFLIGSVHYILTENGRLCVDYSANKLSQKIQELFNGDTKKLVCEYFNQERNLLKKGNFTILGHADLIRKNNSKIKMFNESESWYRKELKATAKEIAKSEVIVEINTGGIARGSTDCIYPSKEFLTLLKEFKVPITISSDCHEKEKIDFAFDMALQELKEIGFTELALITGKNSIKMEKI